VSRKERAPKAILWDVMDTLVVDPFRHVMPGFFGMTLREMLELKQPGAWVRFELSELTEAEFLATFFKDGRQYDREGFKACVRASYEWVEGIEPLLASLVARGMDMHALSNYPEWYTWIEQRLGLSRYLSWTFVSCDTRVRKPDPEAYELAARRLALPADQLLFVDDRAVNCEAARAAGMQAIHFENDVVALRRALVATGALD
jgi:FMN hydrolase / 5-amino-6-(5-phospho-D-ribitylamino)uracil phosphatase